MFLAVLRARTILTRVLRCLDVFMLALRAEVEGTVRIRAAGRAGGGRHPLQAPLHQAPLYMEATRGHERRWGEMPSRSGIDDCSV